MSAPVTMYGPMISPAVARVAACLLEKDVPFQLEPVDMSKGEHKSPSFLKLQPFGQVPAFRDHLTRVFVHSLTKRSNKPKETMAAGLQVFGQPASTDVARVLTCLFEKNLEFELVRIDTFKRQHKLPEFIKLRDPSGQVTFKHGDKTLVDPRAICRYLCTQFPNEGNKTLYGTGSLERASIEQWLQAEAQNFNPPSSALVFHLAFAPYLNIPQDHAVIAENEKKLQQVLNVYDEVLSKNEYLAGDDFTLADLSHLPNSQYIVNSERGRKLFTSRKNVARWYDKISRRKAWEQVVKMQMEHPDAFE